jgi:hypothetical protein
MLVAFLKNIAPKIGVFFYFYKHFFENWFLPRSLYFLKSGNLEGWLVEI